MTIKARAFKTNIGGVEVEGFFEGENFVFRFYGLVRFCPPTLSVGADTQGTFAILGEAKIDDTDGFVLSLEQNYDSDLACEWGYCVSIRRNDTDERNLLFGILGQQAANPDSINLITPPKQLTSVYFDPRGIIDGSASLSDAAERSLRHSPILDMVRSSAARRILFLAHAIRQMSRPDRMISTSEIRNVVGSGIVIEDYPEDPRGHSCLLVGQGSGGRQIHVVCSPKEEFLAIITAYLPDPREWSDDFKMRLKR